MQIMDIRAQLLIAGVEQSGKTYYAEKLGDIYAQKGGCTFVYNRGRERDFAQYESIEPLTIKQHEQMIKGKAQLKQYRRFPFLAYFKLGGQVYKFKDFYRLTRGRKLVCYRIGHRRTEALFFDAMYQYMADTLIIFDDARPIFRNGLKAEHINLFARKNHAGQLTGQGRRGVDIALIFHNLDKINTESYDYATHLIMFKTTRLPNASHVDNDELAHLIEKCYYEVNKAGKYHYGQINIRGKKPYTYTINKPV